jgi:DNA-binding transcriptional ArsR family regulator
MADTIFQKKVVARRIVSLDNKSAEALGERVRMLILEVLIHKPLSAEELTGILGSMGHKKAVTTIRHHLDALKNAGLVEATRMVEVRGAVMKYYSPTVKAYSYEVPPGFEVNHAKLIQDSSAKIQKILKTIIGDKKFAEEFEKNAVTCAVCKGNHMQEFAATELMNQALVKAMEGHAPDTPISRKEAKTLAKKN